MKTLFAAPFLAACSVLIAPSAHAAPFTAAGHDVNTNGLIQNIASWRYSQGCSWRGGRWVVDAGVGKIVVCRPVRPGPQWRWHSEGKRHGWYDRRQKVWHNQTW